MPGKGLSILIDLTLSTSIDGLPEKFFIVSSEIKDNTSASKINGLAMYQVRINMVDGMINQRMA